MLIEKEEGDTLRMTTSGFFGDYNRASNDISGEDAKLEKK